MPTPRASMPCCSASPPNSASAVLVVQVSPHTRRTVRSTISPAASCLPRAPTMPCPRTTRGCWRCTPATLPAHSGRDRRECRRGARQQFPHARRRRHPRVQSRQPSLRRRCVRPLADARHRDDGAHAFYLGVELARAEIAWRLGKRYAQDEPLDWGVAADAPPTTSQAQRGGAHPDHQEEARRQMSRC